MGRVDLAQTPRESSAQRTAAQKPRELQTDSPTTAFALEDRGGSGRRRPAQEPSPAFRLDELIPLRLGAPLPVNHIALTRPLPRPRATDATLGVLGRPGAGGCSSALRTLVSFSSHPLPGGRFGCGAERRRARGPTVALPFPLCPQTPRAFITVVTHKAPRSLPSLAIGWHPRLSRSPSLPPLFGLLIDIAEAPPPGAPSCR